MTWSAKVDACVAEAVRALLDGADLEAVRRDRNLGLDYGLDHLIGDPLYESPEWDYQWYISDSQPYSCDRVDDLTVEFIGMTNVSSLGSRGGQIQWSQPFLAEIRLAPDREQIAEIHLKFGDAKLGLGAPERYPRYWPDVTDWALALHWARPA